MQHIRTRWAAVGAAVAITLGAGGIGITHATTSSGEKAIYKPINPCRLADLRPAPNTVGPRTSGLGPDEVYTLDGWGAVGDCTLPTGTTGLALNVTAVGPTAATFLRLWPAGETQPTTSNLNPTPGQPPTPNAVNVGLSATGEFSVFNRFGTVAVIIDVVGVYDDHNHDDRYYSKAEIDAIKPIAAFDGGELSVDLTAADTVYRSVTIDAPSDGVIVANSSAYLFDPDARHVVRSGRCLRRDPARPSSGKRCSITTGTSHDFSYLQYGDTEGGRGNLPSEAISGTRHFAVSAGSSTTINLVCDEFLSDAHLADPALSAVFIAD